MAPLSDVLRRPLQVALWGALRGGRPLFERWARPGYFAAGLPAVTRRVLVVTSGSLRAGLWNRPVLDALAERLPPEAELWIACRRRERTKLTLNSRSVPLRPALCARSVCGPLQGSLRRSPVQCNFRKSR